ncbi:MAG TPA: hypothetical protein ENJ62_00955, partial [Bryobacterales bacterium]|nr:hypothetical protein [Bryobacterales bacterium]
MNPVFRAALRCVAEFVSGREGLRVKVGGREAKTSADGTIVIPFLPADDPEAVILARCYLDHEAAHHRETDFHVWHEDVARETPLVRDLANILEDARVEAAIGRRFLGAAVNLARGLEALVRRGRLQPDPQDPVSLIQGLVMATAREEVAGQRALERVRAEARTALAGFFGEDLPARIEALVAAKGPGMASTADALALAREIAAVLEDATREPPPSGAEEGESEEQSGDSAASDAGDEPESAENANDPARADEPSSDQDDGCEGAGGSEPEGASEDGAGREQGVVPDAEPPEASEEPPGAEGAPGSESPVDGPPEAASENGGEDLPGSNEEGERSSAAAEAGPPGGDGSGLTAGAEPFSGDVGGLLRDA